ncbi:suppressor of SWI4 1 homolog isoform X2 [Podarcis raffonei]|uniref:suppressor of SWI4 1 homolog isoform X2 n=1 Tax=Podarcis raffonei TaxID=65483 RepID=UPI0023290C7E|nr:suppressor of SWI4 1 homolog isoform X2 [Podarcis raffonei]
MGRPRKTKNQKKERAAAQLRGQEEFGSVPHSFVFHRGRVGKNLQQLIRDVRRVMQPYTASSLKVRKKNTLKDFVAVAGPLGVTHFLVFTKTPTNINLKFFRLPGGPTLTFRVAQVNLNAIKRCVLINYNPDTQILEFRHYSLKVVPVGISKGLKKIMQEKFPNMSRLEDISELLVRDINLSESEAEQDGSHNTTELPQAYAGRGNMKAQQSAVRLTEIGPRMTLQLIKVEEGLSQGNVLYHSFIYKTEEELQVALARKEARLQLKAERRRKQEADVERKQEQKQAHRKKSLEGIKRKKKQAEGSDSDAEDPGMQEDQKVDEPSDDDMEYYRQEVGEEPDEDLFPQSAKRKRRPSQSTRAGKRHKCTHPAGDQSPAASAGTSTKARKQRTPRPVQWKQQKLRGFSPRQPKGAQSQQPREAGQPAGQHRVSPKARRKRPQAPGQHHTRRQPGSRPWGQGKSGLRQKPVLKGKGSFRKPGRSGKRPA